MWQQPYAEARPRAASALASVWFTAYPASVVTRPDESVLQALGDPHLWTALSAIGVQGVHTGPMKRSGGIRGRDYTPTIDGNFDRISFDIDPGFGTEDDFVAMSRTAAAHNAVVIDDIVPAHTGKGADLSSRGAGLRRLPRPLSYGCDPRGGLGFAPAGPRRPRGGESPSGYGRSAQGQRVHRRAAAEGDFLRAGGEGNRLERHRCDRRRRWRGAPLGIPSLLQGRPALAQLARSHHSPAPR